MGIYVICIGTTAKFFTVVCCRLRHKMKAAAQGCGKGYGKRE